MEQSKSLSQWRFDLKRGTKKTWALFYQDFLGVAPSSYPRLYRALNNYGFWPLFEAIVESAERELTGDPLSYVIAVAKNKWRESEETQEQEEEYNSDLEAAKQRSRQLNESLEKKLSKIQGA